MTGTEEASPLWCAFDGPHEVHEARNEFGGTNYCSGRPLPRVTGTEETREAFAQALHGPYCDCWACLPDGEFPDAPGGAIDALEANPND
jgi:hypothetical protein